VTEPAPSPTPPPSGQHTELAVLLAQMGAVVLSTETVGTTVELVTTLATEAIPGAAGAGVTLVDDRGRRSMAASNSLVEQADALQYRLGAGPCLTSWRDQVPVRVDDVLAETRWPQWCTAVVEVGVRSMLSVPLVAAGTCLGAIKVYSAAPAAFDDRAERLLQLFAHQAAILLVNTQTLADAHRTNLQLTDALENRDVIGQAKGILLAQGAVDDQAAFATLVAASQHTNTKLHTVARQLVQSVISRNADATSRKPDPAGQ
jgi:GAF domain-containing protein